MNQDVAASKIKLGAGEKSKKDTWFVWLPYGFYALCIWTGNRSCWS